MMRAGTKDFLNHITPDVGCDMLEFVLLLGRCSRTGKVLHVRKAFLDNHACFFCLLAR